jgi:dTDP-glucose pyrophosphorylase
MSKEVYPVGGRPVMDYLVERMQAAPCTELRVVTRPDKRDVVENAARHGATVIHAIPATLAQSLVAGMCGIADDDLVLLGFPDSIWEPVNGFARVISLLKEGCEVALGLFLVADPGRHEPVEFDDSGQVLRIEFKPTRPSTSWIWGCAAAGAQTLSGLEHEEEPGVLFDSLCKAGGVAAVCLSDTYIDMGTRAGLREALERVPGDRA